MRFLLFCLIVFTPFLRAAEEVTEAQTRAVWNGESGISEMSLDQLYSLSYRFRDLLDAEQTSHSRLSQKVERLKAYFNTLEGAQKERAEVRINELEKLLSQRQNQLDANNARRGAIGFRSSMVRAAHELKALKDKMGKIAEASRPLTDKIDALEKTKIKFEKQAAAPYEQKDLISKIKTLLAQSIEGFVNKSVPNDGPQLVLVTKAVKVPVSDAVFQAMAENLVECFENPADLRSVTIRYYEPRPAQHPIFSKLDVRKQSEISHDPDLTVLFSPYQDRELFDSLFRKNKEILSSLKFGENPQFEALDKLLMSHFPKVYAHIFALKVKNAQAVKAKAAIWNEQDAYPHRETIDFIEATLENLAAEARNHKGNLPFITLYQKLSETEREGVTEMIRSWDELGRHVNSMHREIQTALGFTNED